MWRLCALCAVLVSGEPCDDGRFNIHVDLPDESAYLCQGDYIPPPSKVSPSIAAKYKQENTHHACMDVRISYEARIPNSGAHRPIWAKYGEYIYCPPQRFVHNLQHAGVAFLYHPCVDQGLKEAFSYLARSYTPRHIITPLPSLSREKPLALAAWCSTLEMSHINLLEIGYWLKENVYQGQQDVTNENGTYQHLLIRPAKMSQENINPNRIPKVLHTFSSHRGQSVWHLLKKRKRAVLAVTSVFQDVVSKKASVSISSSTPVGHPKYLAKNSLATTLLVATGTQPSPPNSSISSAPVSFKSNSDSQAVKADIHSRETEGNEKIPVDEPPVQAMIPPQGNTSNVVHELNVSQSIGSNISHEKGHETQEDRHVDSRQTKAPVNTIPSPKVIQQSQHEETERKLLPTTTEKTPETRPKQECSCKHHDMEESSAKAQRRLGASQQKSSDAFISTPRTEEATWAAVSLIFLFVLLTFSILYTQIYKKFRKSQSLYWLSESHAEERETVAAVIKRRLVQGHSGRKKWFGRKKSPVLLYEGLSESSD